MSDSRERAIGLIYVHAAIHKFAFNGWIFRLRTQLYSCDRLLHSNDTWQLSLFSSAYGVSFEL